MSLELLNSTLFDFIFGFANRSLLLDDTIVFFAEYLPYLMLGGVGFMILYRKKPRMRLLLVIEATLALILSYGIVTASLRFFYHHPRPFMERGFEPLIAGTLTNSFPSGHAAVLFALLPLVFSLDRRFGFAYLVPALLSGFARIVVGVHWPFDIVGGAVLGVLGGLLVRQLLSPLVRGVKHEEPLP